jgi:hypothetical protein
METITLEFQPNLKAKILEMLSTFSSDQVKIVYDDSNFDENKQKLQAVSKKIENGTAQFCSFEALDESLEKIISKYEN